MHDEEQGRGLLVDLDDVSLLNDDAPVPELDQEPGNPVRGEVARLPPQVRVQQLPQAFFRYQLLHHIQTDELLQVEQFHGLS
jgi:hypothetical protein